MNALGRLKDDIYFELWHQHSAEAQRDNLLAQIERQTGKRLADYFKDRKGAQKIQNAVIDWALENYETIGDRDKINLLKSEDSPEEIAKYIGGPVFRDMLHKEFGKSRMIYIGNKILSDPDLRDEFYAEGAAISSRDFSFLLEDE